MQGLQGHRGSSCLATLSQTVPVPNVKRFLSHTAGVKPPRMSALGREQPFPGFRSVIRHLGCHNDGRGGPGPEPYEAL